MTLNTRMTDFQRKFRAKLAILFRKQLNNHLESMRDPNCTMRVEKKSPLVNLKKLLKPLELC